MVSSDPVVVNSMPIIVGCRVRTHGLHQSSETKILVRTILAKRWFEDTRRILPEPLDSSSSECDLDELGAPWKDYTRSETVVRFAIGLKT